MTTTPTRRLPTLILPPGWVHLPVLDDNAPTAARTLAPLAARGPRDSVTPYVREAERSLVVTLDEARDAGSFAVALPLGLPALVPVSTAIALRFLDPAGGTAVLPETGESVQTDAGAARRRIVDAAPVDADADEVVLLRTIDYTWLHDGRYLLAFASISGLPGPDYRPITDAMTLLVTTMLDALTWPTADGEVSS